VLTVKRFIRSLPESQDSPATNRYPTPDSVIICSDNWCPFRFFTQLCDKTRSIAIGRYKCRPRSPVAGIDGQHFTAFLPNRARREYWVAVRRAVHYLFHDPGARSISNPFSRITGSLSPTRCYGAAERILASNSLCGRAWPGNHWRRYPMPLWYPIHYAVRKG